MLCVVKRLAAAMSSLWTPATNAESSASISALRYAFCRGILRLAEVEVVTEGRRVERLAVGVVDAARDDEQIRRVLVELLGALCVQGVRQRLPDGLVDADDVAAGPDQEDVRARDGREVDRPRERDRQTRLDVEAVERVEDGDVVAAQRVGRAVR